MTLQLTTIERIGTFFFNDTATTEIYTLSLHDALPICTFRPGPDGVGIFDHNVPEKNKGGRGSVQATDRKSTRLNSSHSQISYAVFCLKKKKLFIRRYPAPVFLLSDIMHAPRRERLRRV